VVDVMDDLGRQQKRLLPLFFCTDSLLVTFFPSLHATDFPDLHFPCGSPLVLIPGFRISAQNSIFLPHDKTINAYLLYCYAFSIFVNQLALALLY
jgi:hypothetical protein